MADFRNCVSALKRADPPHTDKSDLLAVHHLRVCQQVSAGHTILSDFPVKTVDVSVKEQQQPFLLRHVSELSNHWS